jgi:hypothetical protein
MFLIEILRFWNQSKEIRKTSSLSLSLLPGLPAVGISAQKQHQFGH